MEEVPLCWTVGSWESSLVYSVGLCPPPPPTTVSPAVTLGLVLESVTLFLLYILLWFALLFFPVFGLPHSLQEFPGQASNPRQSCKLHHSCSNTGSLTHRAGLGDQTSSATETRQDC